MGEGNPAHHCPRKFRGNSTEFPLDIRRCHNCVTTDDVKAWMRRYADLLREADLLRARADAIRSRAASPPTSAVDGMPRGPSFEGDRIGGVISTADVIEGQVAEKEADGTYEGDVSLDTFSEFIKGFINEPVGTIASIEINNING